MQVTPREWLELVALSTERDPLPVPEPLEKPTSSAPENETD